MIEIFDVASVVILACIAVFLRAIPLMTESPRRQWGIWGGIVLVVIIIRIAVGTLPALDMASAAMLVLLALAVGRELLVYRRWPVGMFVAAIAVVTAVGVYLRADRFDLVIHSAERQLQPDVRYYQQQAAVTANPFAAGWKSPLWPALHAPLLRIMEDRDLAMRLWSWGFGVMMIPLVAVAVGRLFEPVVGIIVAGMLAADPWLIDLCCEGLREEFGLCLWMLVLLLLFGVTDIGWKRIVTMGIMAGVLLLLRNIALVPLLVMIMYAAINRRWSYKQAVVGLLLPIVLVSPFYINQWCVHGDPFAMEKRDARYHANLEFDEVTAPEGLTMPTAQQRKGDLYVGEPISPLAYLLRYRTLRDFIEKQWQGIKRTFLGDPFDYQASLWLRLSCAVGLIATLLTRQQRFAFLFVFFSIAGIRAHLLAVNQLDERLLIPVWVIWLASGWSLIAWAVRTGLRQWHTIRR